jgi:hypothetical protein
MDDWDVLWDFAEESTKAVSLVASKLAGEKTQPPQGWRAAFSHAIWPEHSAAAIYLAKLAVNLKEITGFIIQQPARLEDVERLRGLLAELERVCNVKLPTPN